jgi:hypothetical protein
LQRSFFWIGVLATFVGLWDGGEHLWDAYLKHSKERIEERRLVTSTVKISVDGTSQIGDANIVADTIEIKGGEHVVPAGSVWFANTILLADGATVKTTRMAIVASTIHGGRFDLSGANGASPGAPGAIGGELLVAAGHVTDVQFIVRGGRGATGGMGPAGADGRDGNCAGFGGYRGADPGRDGGTGGTGGQGGDAGRLRIAAEEFIPLPTAPDYEGGEGGPGGTGGYGGRGGSGCTGLGGSQPDQPGGRTGLVGQPGNAGRPRSPDIRTLSYKTLSEMVESQDGKPAEVVHAVAQRVFGGE